MPHKNMVDYGALDPIYFPCDCPMTRDHNDENQTHLDWRAENE